MNTKAKKPLFYNQVVPISREQHAKLRIKPGAGYDYAKDANAVLLTVMEFPFASREYPIVFIEDGDTVNPAAVLGLNKYENQFLNSDGTWDAGYVPAYVRRYPFITGITGDNGEDLVVCIDESAAVFNTSEGKALFDESGEHTEFLKKSIEFLQDYQGQVQHTSKFSSRMKELGLLAPMRADFQVKGGAKTSLAGFKVVDRDKLKALPKNTLVKLLKSDELELIYLHLASLGNFKNLASRYAKVA
ncbi:MAG: SapC family protein [Gammaproteobacteria bacterium]